MKCSLVVLCLSFALSVCANAQKEKAVFVLVTTAGHWPDGYVSAVGEVERVVASDANHYMFTSPAGVQYAIPMQAAQIISPEQAALRLLAQRQQLDLQLQAAAVSLKQAQPQIPLVIPQAPAVILSNAAIGNGDVESRIDGDFEGWTGDTLFKLVNGQIWQQASYAYTYHYAFDPKVIIFNAGGTFRMKVDGVSDSIPVKRLR